MENLVEMISLINEYLKSQLTPMTMGDWVSYILENLQYIAIIIGVIFSYWTYKKTKNQEIYAKLLGEVYAPLYSYLVKQEVVRKMLGVEGDYHETPILDYISKITKTTYLASGNLTKITEEAVLGLDRKEWISAIDSINAGLAPQRLYTLLNTYKVLVYHEEKHREEKNLDIYLDATILKVHVENMLRKEIISGYKECYKKLGLIKGKNECCNRKNTTGKDKTNIEFKLTDDHIKFDICIDEDVKAKIKQGIEKNLNKYK